MVNSSKIFLSIIIPVFNRQQGLDSFINDLSKSKNIEDILHLVEIIVVDDASNPAITKTQTNFQISYYYLDKNSGAPKARELGFKESQGQFIHFHDSDDSVSRDWLIDVFSQLEKCPEIDVLMTARFDQDRTGKHYQSQKYFNQQVLQVEKIRSRLVYRNCMGPLGGVTFSRRVLESLDFKSFSSCQDWQMYLHVIEYSQVLKCLPDTHFYFNKGGDDRISHNPKKKILGHLQLAKITGSESVFKRNIRLFYLYTCKDHIVNKGGRILAFYKKNRLKILFTYVVVSIYWRLT